MIEIWKPLPEYEDYQISDLGNVRTTRKINRNAKSRDIRAINPYSTGRYRVFDAHNDLGTKVFTVHRAVLIAHIGLPPEGMECCHYDGDRDNNRLDNLRWDTKSENNKDCVRHGNHPWSKAKQALTPKTEEDY